MYTEQATDFACRWKFTRPQLIYMQHTYCWNSMRDLLDSVIQNVNLRQFHSASSYGQMSLYCSLLHCTPTYWTIPVRSSICMLVNVDLKGYWSNEESIYVLCFHFHFCSHFPFSLVSSFLFTTWTMVTWTQLGRTRWCALSFCMKLMQGHSTSFLMGKHYFVLSMQPHE